MSDPERPAPSLAAPRAGERERLAELLEQAEAHRAASWWGSRYDKVADCLFAHGVTLAPRVSEAGPDAVLREALLNVSIHSAHLPDAPRELLIELLKRCGEIARAALSGPRSER